MTALEEPTVVNLIKARVSAARLLAADQVDDQAFRQARQVHLIAYAEYASQRNVLAAAAPEQNLDMYETVTAESALNSWAWSWASR